MEVCNSNLDGVKPNDGLVHLYFEIEYKKYRTIKEDVSGELKTSWCYFVPPKCLPSPHGDSWHADFSSFTASNA